MGGHAETQGISTVFGGSQGVAGGLPGVHAFAAPLIPKVILGAPICIVDDAGCVFRMLVLFFIHPIDLSMGV